MGSLQTNRRRAHGTAQTGTMNLPIQDPPTRLSTEGEDFLSFPILLDNRLGRSPVYIQKDRELTQLLTETAKFFADESGTITRKQGQSATGQCDST